MVSPGAAREWLNDGAHCRAAAPPRPRPRPATATAVRTGGDAPRRGGTRRRARAAVRLVLSPHAVRPCRGGQHGRPGASRPRANASGGRRPNAEPGRRSRHYRSQPAAMTVSTGIDQSPPRATAARPAPSVAGRAGRAPRGAAHGKAGEGRRGVGRVEGGDAASRGAAGPVPRGPAGTGGEGPPRACRGGAVEQVAAYHRRRTETLGRGQPGGAGRLPRAAHPGAGGRDNRRDATRDPPRRPTASPVPATRAAARFGSEAPTAAVREEHPPGAPPSRMVVTRYQALVATCVLPRTPRPPAKKAGGGPPQAVGVPASDLLDGGAQVGPAFFMPRGAGPAGMAGSREKGRGCHCR